LSQERTKKKEKHWINPILVSDDLFEVNEKFNSGFCRRALILGQEVAGGTVQILPSEARRMWEGATGISEGCILTSRWRSRLTFSNHRLTR
jgi:hypothetical protein